jgi:hypothetical protein
MKGIINAFEPIRKYFEVAQLPKAAFDTLLNTAAQEVADLIHGNSQSGINPLDPKQLDHYLAVARQAARSRTKDPSQAKAVYTRMAIPAIRRVANNYYKLYAGKVNTLVSGNAAVHAHAQATTTAPAPPPQSGAAPQNSISARPSAERLPGESYEDFTNRVIRSALTPGVAAR